MKIEPIDIEEYKKNPIITHNLCSFLVGFFSKKFRHKKRICKIPNKKSYQMIVAGTGHRPNKLGGYDLVTFNKLVKLAEKNLQFLNATYVISGMALGWDMALAKAAINLNIPFAAYIPFKDQPILWPHSSQLLYFQLLEKADKIVNTSNSDSYTAIKMQKRNEKMVDDCDILLAIWDGSFGGTANCLKYAVTKNVMVINIYSEYK